MAVLSMREVGLADYRLFIAQQNAVTVGQSQIRLLGRQRPKLLQPPDFKLETTTLWSFPKRGAWATHKASYRGNWAPQIARNIILRYSQPGDLVLDQMVGGGTTLVECKLTGRHAIGVDVNREALMLTLDRLNFPLTPEEPAPERRSRPVQREPQSQLALLERSAGYAPSPALRQAQGERAQAPAESVSVRGELVEPRPEPDIRLYQGDARNLDLIGDESIDLIATHPPYANIIRYSKRAQSKAEGEAAERIPNDLSNVRDIGAYVREMERVAEECYRVLKPDHYCAVLVGDTRRNRHHVPIAFRVMQAFLRSGFVLKEDIIKAQWNTMTEGLWANLSRQKNFLLLMHEHLFIFRKPARDEDVRPYRESTSW